MHHISRIDWSFASEPGQPVDFASGLHRVRIIGPEHGAVHTDLYVGALDPRGWLAPHVHSYEECLHVLEGELLVRVDARVHRLVPGDRVLFPVGVRHGLGNAGGTQARWISLNSPIKRDPSTSWPDTFYDPPEDLDAMVDAASSPPFGDPTLRDVGRDIPIDRAFGADLLTMSGVAWGMREDTGAHDHPYEEAIVILEGDVFSEIDGERGSHGPGDVVLVGVGSVHRFWSDGDRPVRSLRTQAPQPPARHAVRSADTWQTHDRQRSGGR